MNLFGFTIAKTADLKDILSSLEHLMEVIKDVPEPTRAILSSQLFLAIQKVHYLMGENQ